MKRVQKSFTTNLFEVCPAAGNVLEDIVQDGELWAKNVCKLNNINSSQVIQQEMRVNVRLDIIIEEGSNDSIS